MLRATFSGSAYVGVFASVFSDVVLARRDLDPGRIEAISDELEATVFPSTIGGGATVGSLASGNDHGGVVSGQVTSRELEQLEEWLARPILAMPGPFNAAGNLILTNDHGALIPPDLSEDAGDAIAETLGVCVERGTIAGMSTVGMAAVATNKGVLCHPQATEAELDRLEEVLQVPADLGTINYGSPLIGSGLLANAHGYVAGERTTGPELGRIEEALDLID